jgi:cytochrome c-type biogenesis protein CcmE
VSILVPKHQRLILVVVALFALTGAGLAGSYALRTQASYFYLPAQMLSNPPKPHQAVRLGGMVEAGSVRTEADGVTIAFVVTDQGGARVPVRFSGIKPDLFVEGSGVVAEGRLLPGGVFKADNLLAKHDENYVPRELKDMHQPQNNIPADTIAAVQ